ncbi:MAG: hypothetical protein R3338_00850, partial [Thermoanaerobaculia bacterium]|nr:hypothetical protein [Thermoanaerobaculia bacterium]
MRFLRRHPLLLVFLLLSSAPSFGQNLVTNGSFDSNLANWSEDTDTDHFSWESLDRNGSGASGSMGLFAFGSASTVRMVQCLSSVAVGGGQINFGGSVWFPSTDDGSGVGSVGVYYFSTSNCTGSQLGSASTQETGGPGKRNQWFDIASSSISVPSGTNSITVFAQITRQSGSSFTARFDEIFLESALPPSTIDIFGPTDVSPGTLQWYAAAGTDCTGPTKFGWTWNVSDGSANHGGRERALVGFPSSPGSVMISASHPNCGSASGTKMVTVATTGAKVAAGGYSYMYQAEGTAL